MRIDDFKLEHFFARWEFSAPWLLCSSDVEALALRELLALADDEGRRLWDELRLGYTETLGLPALRREIAGLYRGVEAEHVIVFAGGQEPIFVLMNALLEPGDHAVVVTPCYQSLYAIPRAIGASVTRVPLDPERGWELDLDRVARAITSRTRLVVANFPNSPTGALPDRATFEGLVTLAESAGAVLLSDEVYRLLEHDPADRLPAAVEASERAVTLSVMSKVFGLAGLRIGWLASRDHELLRRVESFKHYTTICSSAPSEILTLVALRAREALLARAREIVLPNLRRFDRFLDDWQELVECVTPRGGTIAFPRLRASISIEEIARELVEATGVLILPGSIFDEPGTHFRIGFGRRSFPEALARFEGFLAGRFPGRRSATA
jgi:aspartate/methionine/tyrosine aminotransferase